MSSPLQRFEQGGKRYVVDTETCFCFECDEISWDVLDYYPDQPVNRILQLLEGRHARAEMEEVISELEWLRATKSILPAMTQEKITRDFEYERGLKRLTVQLEPAVPGEADTQQKGFWSGRRATQASPKLTGNLAVSAAQLLLARAGDQKNLYLELIVDSFQQAQEMTSVIEGAFQSAGLAGKSLTVALRHEDYAIDGEAELAPHRIAVIIELVSAANAHSVLRSFAPVASLKRVQQLAQHSLTGVHYRIELRPGTPAFAAAVQRLDELGFNDIEIDMPGAYFNHAGIDPEAMQAGLKSTAMYYATRLLEHHYFKLEPVAGLFLRIYNGSPLRRADPAGTNELAIDAKGNIFASRWFLKTPSLILGNLHKGKLDESALAKYDDLGVNTTPDCIRCWARRLCGGGMAAIHYSYTHSAFQPHVPWCDAQRDWLASAVVAFNLLSTQGINFTRLHQNLGLTSKPSLRTMMKAAFTMSIGLRPIEERDGALLTKWENWNSAAYFLFNESGLFLATRYDREMDSLHPRGYEHEFILLHKDGASAGLIKVRPERAPGSAMVWIYLHDPKNYASPAIRRSLRMLLDETRKRQEFRRLIVPAAEHELGLQSLLTAMNFALEGTQREALYFHGAYRSVHIYGMTA